MLDAAVGQLNVEHRALYRGESHWDDVPDGAGWDDGTIKVAAASFDPHQVKMVEACQRGFKSTGDPRFALARVPRDASQPEGLSRQEVIRRAALDRCARSSRPVRVTESTARMTERWGDVFERLGSE